MSVIPKKAVHAAIEGGWRPTKFEVGSWSDEGSTYDFKKKGDGWTHKELRHAEIALDPSFWQALGKVLRWGTLYCLKCKKDFLFPDARCECKKSSRSNVADWGERKDWKHHAARFYDLILTKGDTDAFWQEILSADKE